MNSDNNSYVLQAFTITGVDGSSVPTGVVTQIYPAYVTAGNGTTNIRQPIGGMLLNVEVSPNGGVGGTIEVYDIAGLKEGASNNVSTGTDMTSAFVAAEIAAKRAKLIWTQVFSGSSSNRIARMAIPTRVDKGLAVRVYGASPGDVTLSFSSGVLWRTVNKA